MHASHKILYFFYCTIYDDGGVDFELFPRPEKEKEKRRKFRALVYDENLQ